MNVRAVLVVSIFLFIFCMPLFSVHAQPSCVQKTSGDANCDDKVDLADYEIFRKEYTGLLTTKTADFNVDGQINLMDFEVWRRGFFAVSPTQTSISVTVTVTVTPTPNIQNTACSFTVSSNQTQVDGKGNYSQVKPGDVLCLSAGSRPPLAIINLNGTANAPIIIRNEGGVVRITGAGTQRGFSLAASNYVHISGNGISENCGSRFTPEQNNCGFNISGVGDGIEVSDTTPMGHIEINHIYVHDTDHAKWDSGIAVKPRNGTTLSYFYFHHNIIVNTDHEGMYIGADPNKPLSDNGKLQNVEVSFNLVKHTGFDGINIKQAKTGNKIHHNIVVDTGFLTGQVQHVPEGGIQLADAYADVYNNFVLDSFDTGINMGRPSGGGQSRYFDNVVINAKNTGIDLNEDGAVVYNNTVINSEGDGIRATGYGVQLFDNVVADTKGTPIKSSGSVSNNFTGTGAGAGFQNPGANDYSLKQGSPLIDGGRNNGIFPAFDYLDVARPQGAKTDIGAYEYR